MNQTLDRVLLARSVALAAGAAAAVLVNEALQPGSLLAWVAAVFAGVTLALFGLHRARVAGRFPAYASPAFGALGWGVYATFTGSLESPFIAAFFLEIAVAAISMGSRGVLWVTAWCLGAIGLMRVPFGLIADWPLLLLETFFVLATGGLGVAIARRRRQGDLALRTQGLELGGRLESLQKKLEDERTVARVGENVARLAHGLKNTVHSLRGFVSLIEPQLEEKSGGRAALVGLQAAIDDLEKLARLTLAEEGEATVGASNTALDPANVAAVSKVVEVAMVELTQASPGVEWELQKDAEADRLGVPLGESTLLELLVILLRNGVEAMAGEGAGRIEIRTEPDTCRLIVEDTGPGFGADDLASIFQPGYTTKEKGSGFGLFLARRIVEDAGGRLELGEAASGGARVQVELPRCPSDE